MLLFVDGCRARLNFAQLMTAHCEGHRKSGDQIRESGHNNSDSCETGHVCRNKTSGRNGVVKTHNGGRHNGSSCHDDGKRQRRGEGRHVWV